MKFPRNGLQTVRDLFVPTHHVGRISEGSAAFNREILFDRSPSRFRTVATGQPDCWLVSVGPGAFVRPPAFCIAVSSCYFFFYREASFRPARAFAASSLGGCGLLFQSVGNIRIVARGRALQSTSGTGLTAGTSLWCWGCCSGPQRFVSPAVRILAANQNLPRERRIFLSAGMFGSW